MTIWYSSPPSISAHGTTSRRVQPCQPSKTPYIPRHGDSFNFVLVDINIKIDLFRPFQIRLFPFYVSPKYRRQLAVAYLIVPQVFILHTEKNYPYGLYFRK